MESKREREREIMDFGTEEVWRKAMELWSTPPPHVEPYCTLLYLSGTRPSHVDRRRRREQEEHQDKHKNELKEPKRC